MKRILLIGATGRVGRALVAQLPAAVQVRALVRNPEAAGLPAKVEIVAGDLTRVESLETCLNGVDAVFLVWTAPAAAVAPALERIMRKTPRIVFLSSPYKTMHPFFQASQPNAVAALHAQIERLIENSRCEWTFLRPGIFAANAIHWWGPRIHAGSNRAGSIEVRWPYTQAFTAPIDERDIAAVAVRALCDTGHSGTDYVLTGPESLTQSAQLATIGDAIGRPLRMKEISPEEARRELFADWPPRVANMLLEAWAAAIGQPAFVTTTVADITGVPARIFRQWTLDHVGEFLTPPG